MNSTFILSSSFFNKRVCTSSKFDHKQQFDISSLIIMETEKSVKYQN